MREFILIFLLGGIFGFGAEHVWKDGVTGQALLFAAGMIISIWIADHWSGSFSNEAPGKSRYTLSIKGKGFLYLTGGIVPRLLDKFLGLEMPRDSSNGMLRISSIFCVGAVLWLSWFAWAMVQARKRTELPKVHKLENKNREMEVDTLVQQNKTVRPSNDHSKSGLMDNSMATSRCSFDYSTLQSDHFRLIKLSRHSGPNMRCQIAHFSLSSCPTYTALSYAWGNTSKTHQIVINERYLDITGNLNLFLQQARDSLISGKWEGGWLWVDAICIDQNTIEERNKQVPRMKDIYEKADKIIIWLGPIERDGQRAMFMVDYLARLNYQGGQFNTQQPFDKRFFGPEGRPFSPEYWDALKALMDRPWWRRAWIVQEASTPKDYNRKVVWCGHITCPLAWFLFSNRQIYQASTHGHFGAIYGIFSSSCQALFAFEFQRDDEVAYGKMRLLDLLPTMRQCESTDPRDRIYAILSICLERGDTALRPDYSLPVDEVYINLATHLLVRDQNLDILGHCTFERREKLPSWVPDWTARHISQDFAKRQLPSRSKVYSASRALSSDVYIDRPHRSLKAVGVVFARVRDVGLARTGSGDAEVAGSWVRLALDHRSKYPTGCTRLEALRHTLCADIKGETESFAHVERGGTVPFTEPSGGIYRNDVFLTPMTLNRTTLRRKLIITSNGYIGLAPRQADRGDLVCILWGGQIPFLLREEERHFILIGETYVHGIMDGEAFDSLESGIRTFEIR